MPALQQVVEPRFGVVLGADGPGVLRPGARYSGDAEDPERVGDLLVESGDVRAAPGGRCHVEPPLSRAAPVSDLPARGDEMTTGVPAEHVPARVGQGSPGRGESAAARRASTLLGTR